MTLTAAETFESRVGNCLSQTNLFVASARYVGLDAVYEVAQLRPTWDHAGQAILRYEHIVASGILRGSGAYVFDYLHQYAPGRSYM